MEVETNNCIGPLDTANSCSTYIFKINKLHVSSCCAMLKRPTNEFASEIATGNLISMFKLNYLF